MVVTESCDAICVLSCGEQTLTDYCCGVGCVQLYRKIVLSGGSTMYPGFSTRLHADVSRNYLREVLKGNKKKLSVCCLLLVMFLLFLAQNTMKLISLSLTHLIVVLCYCFFDPL